MTPEVYENGAELCLYFSQRQLSEMLDIDEGKVFLLGSRPDRSELPELLIQRVDYLLEMSRLLERRYGRSGVSQWFGLPNAEIDYHFPVSAFLGEWTPDEEGPRIIRKLAEWDVKQWSRLDG